MDAPESKIVTFTTTTDKPEDIYICTYEYNDTLELLRICSVHYKYERESEYKPDYSKPDFDFDTDMYPPDFETLDQVYEYIEKLNEKHCWRIYNRMELGTLQRLRT